MSDAASTLHRSTDGVIVLISKTISQREKHMDHFLDWRDFAGVQPEKFFKATLWKGQYVMLGLNCLEPGQSQAVHAHVGADKFYFVLTGEGSFNVGEETRDAGVGTIVIAPAGVAHGVRNGGRERLSLLVGIAPEVR